MSKKNKAPFNNKDRVMAICTGGESCYTKDIVYTVSECHKDKQDSWFCLLEEISGNVPAKDFVTATQYDETRSQELLLSCYEPLDEFFGLFKEENRRDVYETYYYKSQTSQEVKKRIKIKNAPEITKEYYLFYVQEIEKYVIEDRHIGGDYHRLGGEWETKGYAIYNNNKIVKRFSKQDSLPGVIEKFINKMGQSGWQLDKQMPDGNYVLSRNYIDGWVNRSGEKWNKENVYRILQLYDEGERNHMFNRLGKEDLIKILNQVVFFYKIDLGIREYCG